MGSGKTTIGRRVAQALGMDFFDTDEEIEKRTGVSVSIIFDIEGEPGFRKREKQMLEHLAEQDGALIATGGGAVLSAANRALMKRNGYVVWLRTTVEQQIKRLENDRQRPLLQLTNRREKLEELASERDPLYRELADLVFDSRDRSPRYMARELTARLRAVLQNGGIRDHALH